MIEPPRQPAAEQLLEHADLQPARLTDARRGTSASTVACALALRSTM
jgi:hypothetical protein